MRIGIFTDDYLPRISGVISSILVLRDGLERQGHEVYLIVPGHKDLKPDQYVIQVSSAKTPMDNMRAALPKRKFIEEILDLHLDVVHSMTQYNMGVLADYIASKADIPHVTTMHTIVPELMPFYPARTAAGYMYCATLYLMYFGERARTRWPAFSELMSPKKSSIPILKRQLYSLMNVYLNNTDHVVVPSRHVQMLLQENRLKTNCSVISNGVNPMFYGHRRTRKFMNKGTLRVLCVGRLSFEKRQDVVIKAVNLVPNVELSIIGDGPSASDLRNIAKSSNVVFHGAHSPEYVRDQMLEADVLILASYKFDTQGLVLLEAAAAGLPVIYCDENLHDSVSPQASILADHTVEGIAQSFRDIQTKDLTKMSRAARSFARQFDYDHFAQKCLTLYRSLI